MAYTDPNTGITRDKYGNEIHDPSATDRKPEGNYAAWVFGLIIAALVALAVVSAMNTQTADDGTTVQTPTSQQTAPQPPPPPAQ